VKRSDESTTSPMPTFLRETSKIYVIIMSSQLPFSTPISNNFLHSSRSFSFEPEVGDVDARVKLY
jgi:hypothetical protein